MLLQLLMARHVAAINTGNPTAFLANAFIARVIRHFVANITVFVRVLRQITREGCIEKVPVKSLEPRKCATARLDFMRTQIKICGIASLAEAQLALAAGADALGFVCARPASPRTIDDRLVAEIVPQIPRSIATYLLTSELTAEGIADHVKRAGTSTVQILAPIKREESRQLRELLPDTRCVQVIHVENESALDYIEQYAANVDAFLLDSGKPSLPTPEFGGTGRTHDWSVSAEFVRRSLRPVFLAGGLTPENVGKAIGRVRPYGVDLYSGARSGGALNQEKLSAFVGAVRRLETV